MLRTLESPPRDSLLGAGYRAVPGWRNLVAAPDLDSGGVLRREGSSRSPGTSSDNLVSQERENQNVTSDTPKKKPGPKPDRLNLKGDWVDALRKALAKPRPKGGWPKPDRKK